MSNFCISPMSSDHRECFRDEFHSLHSDASMPNRQSPDLSQAEDWYVKVLVGLDLKLLTQALGFAIK